MRIYHLMFFFLTGAVLGLIVVTLPMDNHMKLCVAFAIIITGGCVGMYIEQCATDNRH